MGGHLPPQHGDQGLQLGVKLRLLLVWVGSRPLQLVPVLHCLGQILPDDGSGGHPGDGSLMPLVVGELGVLSQRQLHGRRGLDDHVVQPAAGGLHGYELAADGVGAARTGQDRGHSRQPRVPEAAVHRVHSVDGPQVGGAGVSGLVAVVPLKAHGVPEHPQVAVGVHEARQDVPPPGIQRLPLPVGGTLLHRSHLPDLSLPYGYKPVVDGRSVHGVHRSVNDQHILLLSGNSLVDIFVIIWYICQAAQPNWFSLRICSCICWTPLDGDPSGGVFVCRDKKGPRRQLRGPGASHRRERREFPFFSM